MAISLPDHHEDLTRERQADALLTLDSRAEEAAAATAGGRRKTAAAAAAGADAATVLRVVIDVREFRSSLPNLLHAAGYELVPKTLQVGDYVIAAEICVERKSVSDLHQSLQSGRLYNQAEEMSRHYKLPCLLIEFDPQKAFSLQSAADIEADIKASHVTSRLATLAMSFPNLRILWSRSAQQTAEIFRSLMVGHAPADVDKAVAAGADTADLGSAGGGGGGGGGVAGGKRADDGDADASASDVARDMLLNLPGVNVHNFRTVMGAVPSLAAWAGLDEEELGSLAGPVNGKKLHAFLHRRT